MLIELDLMIVNILGCSQQLSISSISIIIYNESGKIQNRKPDCELRIYKEERVFREIENSRVDWLGDIVDIVGR